MNQVQKRSSFVDVVAWVFIVLSGFVTLIAIMLVAGTIGTLWFVRTAWKRAAGEPGE